MFNRQTEAKHSAAAEQTSCGIRIVELTKASAVCLIAIVFLALPSARAQVHTSGKSREQQKAEEMDHSKMEGSMPSSFGIGSMSRQGSGTSWQPEATPIYAFMKNSGSWMWMIHPYVFSTFTHQSGKLGDDKFFSTNWVMVSAQREVGGLTKAGKGTLMIRGMFSLEPLSTGPSGYPLLLQGGETYRGVELTNRQHPHDFLMEVAVAYSAPLTPKTVLSVYAAPMGEPALGPGAFMHRWSAADNPEAPISHHWQDSTHISAGVMTIGIAGEKWKVEGSVFTGREPNENRWDFEHPKFDSWSTRFSFNPRRNWAMQISYGFLNDPEVLHPNLILHRLTASAMYHRQIGERSNWATSFIWGRNYKGEKGYGVYSTDAFLVESGYSFKDLRSLFARYESVAKDNLFAGSHIHGRFADIYRVQRFTIGGVHNLPTPGPFEWGIGASFSGHVLPHQAELFFGERPVSATIFLRVRPRRCQMNEC